MILRQKTTYFYFFHVIANVVAEKPRDALALITVMAAQDLFYV